MTIALLLIAGLILIGSFVLPKVLPQIEKGVGSLNIDHAPSVVDSVKALEVVRKRLEAVESGQDSVDILLSLAPELLKKEKK